jgi:DnaJ family protein B protein 13
MFSNSTGKMKPPAIERPLECTLDELCYGCMKKIKITRDVITNTGFVPMF